MWRDCQGNLGCCGKLSLPVGFSPPCAGNETTSPMFDFDGANIGLVFYRISEINLSAKSA